MKNKNTLAKKNQSAPAQKSASHHVVQSEVRSVSYSGPLPPPEHLAIYEETAPGSAERIIAMAEREQAFQHKAQEMALENERRAIDATLHLTNRDLARLDRGQWMAYSLSVLAYSLAGFFAFAKGAEVAAIVSLLAGTVPLVGKFLQPKIETPPSAKSTTKD